MIRKGCQGGSIPPTTTVTRTLTTVVWDNSVDCSLTSCNESAIEIPKFFYTTIHGYDFVWTKIFLSKWSIRFGILFWVCLWGCNFWNDRLLFCYLLTGNLDFFDYGLDSGQLWSPVSLFCYRFWFRTAIWYDMTRRVDLRGFRWWLCYHSYFSFFLFTTMMNLRMTTTTTESVDQ